MSDDTNSIESPCSSDWNFLRLKLIRMLPSSELPLNDPYCILQMNIFISFAAFALLLDWTDLYRSFGFDSQPTIIGLFIIFSYIFAPYNAVSQHIIYPILIYNDPSSQRTTIICFIY